MPRRISSSRKNKGDAGVICEAAEGIEGLFALISAIQGKDFETLYGDGRKP